MQHHKKTWQQQAVSWFARAVVVLVALGAAVLSFDALTALAVAAGIATSLAWMWAVVVDGFILVATVAAFALKDRGWRTTWYPWVTLSLFVILSMIGNGFHAAIAEPNYRLPLGVAVIVTAIPPIALFLAIHMLIVMSSPTEEEKKERERQSKLKERKQRIEDKKLEREEKLAEREAERAEKALVREQTKPVTSAPRRSLPATPKPVAAPVVPTVPDVLGESATEPEIEQLEASTTPDTDVVTYEVVANDATMSEAQATDYIIQEAMSGRILTGQEAGVLMGKSVRTGQNLMKKIKESNPDVFA